MLPLFLMLLAAAAADPVGDNAKVTGPVKVKASDMLIPVGDSLRAATWDNLVEKPTAPRKPISTMGRPRWNQWSVGTSPLATENRLASRASDASRS